MTSDVELEWNLHERDMVSHMRHYSTLFNLQSNPIHLLYLMPLNLLLNPTSTGEVFKSTLGDIQEGTLPTILLHRNHPFRMFLRNHLAELCRTGLYDTVIDALVALTLRDASWRSKKKIDEIVCLRCDSREMREILQHHPPLSLGHQISSSSVEWGIMDSILELHCSGHLSIFQQTMLTFGRMPTGLWKRG